jgi:hypothetical protein
VNSAGADRTALDTASGASMVILRIIKFPLTPVWETEWRHSVIFNFSGDASCFVIVLTRPGNWPADSKITGASIRS